MLHIFATLIREEILSEVKEAKYFTAIVDTTTDVSNQEQFSLVLRYVMRGEVLERLVALVVCADATGLRMFTLIEELFQKHGIGWRKYVLGKKSTIHLIRAPRSIIFMICLNSDCVTGVDKNLIIYFL